MDNLTRQQRLMAVAAGVVGIILFAALTVYYAAAATGHPRVKHMILFIVLAVLSAIVAWFAWPSDSAARGRA